MSVSVITVLLALLARRATRRRAVGSVGPPWPGVVCAIAWFASGLASLRGRTGSGMRARWRLRRRRAII
eukprot:4245328-Lingulodinium_polyedra.AAC.1